MAHRISDRVDDLLEMVLALKREVAQAGHWTDAATPNLARAVSASLAAAGPRRLSQPYEELVPGIICGFQQDSRPDLQLRPAAEGALEISLRQRTSSGWVTIEMDWSAAAIRVKRKLSLLLRGSSPEPLVLNSTLRRIGPGDAVVDMPGGPVTLGPEPSFHVAEFTPSEGGGAAPGDAQEAGHSYRVILFCPVEPFSMTLTELSLR